VTPPPDTRRTTEVRIFCPQRSRPLLCKVRNDGQGRVVFDRVVDGAPSFVVLLADRRGAPLHQELDDVPGWSPLPSRGGVVDRKAALVVW
jgi:hypothetical protein